MLGGFPMAIFTRMILTCVHNSDLEKRDSVFDLSKKKTKNYLFFFFNKKKIFNLSFFSYSNLKNTFNTSSCMSFVNM